MTGTGNALFVLRQLRLQAGQLSASCLHVGLAAQTVQLPAAGEVHHVPLVGDQAKGHLPQYLSGAQLKVGLCDFGLERHQQVVLRFDRLLALRVRGFDRAAHFAEQINFPRGIESQLIKVDRFFERCNEILNGG